MSTQSRKVFIHCRKDTEKLIREYLSKEGFDIVLESARADIVITDDIDFLDKAAAKVFVLISLNKSHPEGLPERVNHIYGGLGIKDLKLLLDRL